MTRPAVSVVVPTFERRDLVVRAVGSVLAQTFGDFELIVVDDGSTDGTDEVLRGLDARIRYEWQENRGVAAARNRGIRLARGEVVAFLDSDNRWLPEHLSVVTSLLALHPEAVFVTTCPSERLAGATAAEEPEVLDLLPELLFEVPVGFTTCIAARRGALLAVGGFDERLPVLEDSDLWLRLSMLGPVCVLRRLTIERHVNPHGLKLGGIASGAYLDAFAVSAANAVEALEHVERRDADDLRRHALGKVALVDGVRAVIAGQHGEARRAFAEACRLVPSLADDPAPVRVLLEHSPLGDGELARVAAAAASAWPDPQSETAGFLRNEALTRPSD